jgi:enoyl-CoA hydratase/carnithine racemase
MSPKIRTERHGHVLAIGVSRADKRNAFDLEMLAGLAKAYEELGEDDDLRVGVLFADGAHFSAGLDLAVVGPAVAAHGPQTLAGGGASGVGAPRAASRVGGPDGLAPAGGGAGDSPSENSGRFDPFGVWGPPVPKPVVMAVQGIAFTLSIELALAADVVVAASDVRFRQLEVGRGIIPFGGATFRAPQKLGWGNAMRFLLTGEEFGAEVALRIGLVQEVVQPGEEKARALAIAELIAAQAPLGVAATLANARVAHDHGDAAAVAHLREVLPGVLSSEDAKEGLARFVGR